MFKQRLAALAEILLVLAAGNLIGEFIFVAMAPASALDGNASDLMLAYYEGLLILLRLGFVSALGLFFLYLRRGITPRMTGLTLNNQPLSLLVAQGLLMGLVSSLLVGLLFALHAIVPLGEGLPAWWSYADTELNTAFWVSLLGTSVLIPPLTEEIMARGYFRVRLVESYGVMSGVILTGLVFGLSHTRYLNGDSMLMLFMGIILINSIAWTYLVQKTGSIVPALIAHSLSNGLGSAILFDIWIPLLISVIGVVLFFKPVKSTLLQFFQDLWQDRERNSIWQGLAIILAVLMFALSMLSLLGRESTLVILGLFSLVVTVINLVSERKSLPAA